MTDSHATHDHDHDHDRPATHGMLMVGEAKVLLSHLPMFMSPHDFQVIFEVTLREPNADPASVYLQSRRTSSERIYTWVPKPFVLPSLFTAPGSAAGMQGTVVRGHFERGGKPITSDQVHADITRVMFSHKLTPTDTAPPRLRYLLFGSPGEAFVAHVITRPPDFDHVLSVLLPQPPVGWDGRALLLEFPGRDNTHDRRLKEGEELDATIVANPPSSVRIKVQREFYDETGDLES